MPGGSRAESACFGGARGLKSRLFSRLGFKAAVQPIGPKPTVFQAVLFGLSKTDSDQLFRSLAERRASNLNSSCQNL